MTNFTSRSDALDSSHKKQRNPGRKATITRDDILTAALKLLGPHRSISSLSLREVTREAGIAPNSFYRHFRDMDELAVALIDKAGISVRSIIREARHRAYNSNMGSVVVSSVQAFMEQLHADEKLLHVLLREGTVGSNEFKQAVERELLYFEEELCADLIRISAANNARLHQPEMASKAITRVVFSVGGSVMDQPVTEQQLAIEYMIQMVRMILVGAQAMDKPRSS